MTTPSTLWTLSNAQLVIEAIATGAFALSGLIGAARRRRRVRGINARP